MELVSIGQMTRGGYEVFTNKENPNAEDVTKGYIVTTSDKKISWVTEEDLSNLYTPFKYGNIYIKKE